MESHNTVFYDEIMIFYQCNTNPSISSFCYMLGATLWLFFVWRSFCDVIYRNDPKSLSRLIWANSADPDQTAPRGAI